ncbi:hypothetical protein HY375_03715, partial [Candidatus Berkelbacteria bacterium]|nr:hypothetical protein [Candidatus Berkelbacteria bacterium]
MAYPNFELTESSPAIDLGALPGLSGYSSFRISLVLHANPAQTKTPRIPSIKVSARPAPPPPSPTTALTTNSRSDGQTGIDVVLRNDGPGSIELANAAPFRVTTLDSRSVYTPSGADQVTSVASGQERRWIWDFTNDAGDSVPAGGYLITLTYQTNGVARTAEARIDVAEARSEPPVTATTGTVLDFGAKCDGRTDDTQAISAAIDAASAAGPGTVTFPAGETCRLSGITKQADDLTLNGNDVTLVSSLNFENAAPVLGLNGSGNVIQNFAIRYEQPISIATGQN